MVLQGIWVFWDGMLCCCVCSSQCFKRHDFGAFIFTFQLPKYNAGLWKLKAPCCFESSETTYPVTQHNVLDGGGVAVTQLVESLHYKPEGCGFDARWGHWIFRWLNPSGRTMALGSTQPVTEMSTRNISGGLTRPVLRADNHITSLKDREGIPKC